MRRHNISKSEFLFVLIILLLTGCKKDKTIPEPEYQYGTVVYTEAITEITYTSAILNGFAGSPSGKTMTSTGFCWGITEISTFGSNIINCGSGVDVKFSYKLTGLDRNTKYYVRAFGITSEDTTLGPSKSFTTISGFPTVRTASVTNEEPFVYIGGGDVSSEGLESVTEYGVYFSTSPEPEITGVKMVATNGMGSFSVVFNDLTEKKTYYLKAYATNSFGTGYGDQVSFQVWNGPVTDIEGNTYNTKLIGSQQWMTENVKTTKFNDGTAIPLVTQNSIWSDLSTPGFCWYNNSEENNKKLYGALYNWHSVNTKKLCPAGWHVPNRDEWVILLNFLSRNGFIFSTGQNYNVARSMATNWDWATSTVPGSIGNDMANNNKSGFSALPAGYRLKDDGTFKNFGYTTTFWSASEYPFMDLTTAWVYELSYNASNVNQKNPSKKNGYSVRCVLDN